MSKKKEVVAIACLAPIAGGLVGTLIEDPDRFPRYDHPPEYVAAHNAAERVCAGPTLSEHAKVYAEEIRKEEDRRSAKTSEVNAELRSDIVENIGIAGVGTAGLVVIGAAAAAVKRRREKAKEKEMGL